MTLKGSTDSPTGKWNKLMFYMLWILFLGSVGWILWSFYEQISAAL
jgi:polyferredoxin